MPERRYVESSRRGTAGEPEQVRCALGQPDPVARRNRRVIALQPGDGRPVGRQGVSHRKPRRRRAAISRVSDVGHTALPVVARTQASRRECTQEGIMGKVYAELDERLRKFIARQSMFFVATAPCLTAAGDGGHVNVSPKGYRDTFAVLGPLTVAYVDLTGSGSETIAHLRQNGRITIMFCSFGKQAKILRIYGRGRVVLPDSPDWPALAARFSL